MEGEKPLPRYKKARTVSATASPATTCPRVRKWCSSTSPATSTPCACIFRPDQETLAALRGSGIGLILGVGGVAAVRGLANSRAAAIVWVHDNVRAYYPDVLIRYIAVGNEVPAGDAGLVVLPAMRNVHAALVAAGLSSSIKVSTAVRMDVFNPRDISLSYATFQPGTTTVRDAGNGLTYTNLFDAMVDAIYAALEKAGAPNVRVVVSETGWPSAGGFTANVENARRYNQAVVDHVRRGTPKRPGVLETYVFAMFNENRKPGDDPTEKHFGLFYPDMQPVYPITFPN
ncbi:hypothetical protein C2845_PM07G34620 [Panicum miliaceum]|uniref:Uncharacterized protein n=1 Tax=Panicum miliaceum TaxID=4540 RepID=A0A3L6SK59_PANMI|nr:hypothetical protein C2845_PM07G34620 [Panicum miliaceum]